MSNKRTIKTIIIFVIIAIFAIVNTGMANASAKSDLSLAKCWAKSHCSKSIKVVKENKVPKNRKGTTYIEVIKTKSSGGYKGYTIKGHYFVRYPKKVKRNKKVTVYLVWNPNNNSCDDVIAMVCLGKVK